jgi:hypothetical protein
MVGSLCATTARVLCFGAFSLFFAGSCLPVFGVSSLTEQNTTSTLQGKTVTNFVTTLDNLPILPQNVTVHEFSSHNKRGVNGDAGWFLYKDEHNDSVIFDVDAPGCIKSIWQTSVAANQSYKFYFDGETNPRYILSPSDLYQGTNPLFPSPLVSQQVAGRYEGLQVASNNFVPIAFRKSLKIATTVDPGFYHILYERYPYGTKVDTFTSKEDLSSLRKAFEHQGEELLPDAAIERISASSDRIAPGEVLNILSVEKAGVIKQIVIEGDGSTDFLKNVEIEMTWDGSPTPNVIAPIGMFFACPQEAHNVKAMPIKVEKLDGLIEGQLRLTCYWRMPFWQTASIRLVNRMTNPAHATGPVKAEVSVAPQTYTQDQCGYFTTLYRQGRTEMGHDWLFFEGGGTGWFLGAVQTMFGSHYCEGDEHFALDGTGMPQINGTGSEDYYLCCFWPNVNINLPFAGHIGDPQVKGGGFIEGAYTIPGCYYRFHLDAPIPFYSQIDARIQHGPMSNILSQYSSLAFCY